jgi:site-specific DNA recombinase
MKKRAVTYARVSSDDRGKDGLNLSGQLELCRSYAQKKGYDIVAELSEDQRGVSGALLNTPALSQALDMAKNKAFDVLIVREVDRFARSLAKQLIVEHEFKKHGVDLEFVMEEFSASPEGNLHKNIKAVIAEYERVKISERTIRGRHQLVKSGNVLVHGRPPYGYQLQRQDGKSQLIIYEPEARIVQLIFDLYVNGDDDRPPLSSREIAEKLCEMGIPGPENGKPKLEEWSQNTIQHFLRSETYVGIWYYGKYSSRDGHRVPHPEHNWLPVEIPSIISHNI